MGPASPSYIADFDSASVMARALAQCLHGRDFGRLGYSQLQGRLMVPTNQLPKGMRRWLYARSGQFEGIGPPKIAEVRAEHISRWIANSYPQRRAIRRS